MNCAECREELAACLEGLLDAEKSRQCREHLETCADCRAEYAAITRLQGRLVAAGQAAAQVSLVRPVMRRVQQLEKQPERQSIMSKLLRNRWGFGLGAAASGVAAVILFILLSSPNSHATAAQIMARGARAVARLTSIHLRGQLRTLPADNFGYINTNCEFCTIELWKQFEPGLKWRAEKPGRLALMDGQSVLLYIKPANLAVKFPQPAPSAFDTDWLHRIANLSNTITNELKNAQAKGWKLGLTEETGADGKAKAVVTINAKSGVPDNDYLKNSFFENADTRRVYRFDATSELLEAVQIYLVRPDGEVLLFELTQLDYNQTFAASLWQVELPADVNWSQEPQKLPDNDKYTAMTAEQAARAFFEACGREDWEEAGKFMSPVTPQLKEYLGGVELVSLGEAFTSKAYGGRFVPYEIKLRAQPFNVRVSNTNNAKRYVLTGILDNKLRVVEEIKWTHEPEILPDNEAYAKMSPAEVVTACFAAQSKLDWTELRRFMPEGDVEQLKRQVEEAQKQGIDPRNLIPATSVGEAVWSAEQGSYLVKAHASGNKKHNVAMRKDNAAGRWQVDGGI